MFQDEEDHQVVEDQEVDEVGQEGQVEVGVAVDVVAEAAIAVEEEVVEEVEVNDRYSADTLAGSSKHRNHTHMSLEGSNTSLSLLCRQLRGLFVGSKPHLYLKVQQVFTETKVMYHIIRRSNSVTLVI